MTFPRIRNLRTLELGSPGPLRQRLNDLVLTGRKVATFGLLDEYRDEAEQPEHPGELLVLVDDDGGEVATVQIVAVASLRCDEVTWAQVEAEGEGDRSIADWRASHERYWAQTGRELRDDSELVWTRLCVVDPVPLLPPRPTAGDLELPEGYRHVYGGKVRDLFATPDNDLLVVASDRISAYDWVLPTLIPDKGRILNRMSLWWFERLADLVDHHVITTTTPGLVGDRGVVCRALDMLPVEAVVRGYLTGSGLKDYRATGGVCGVALPAGLVDGSRLPDPIFTPATKAAIGDHDENIAFPAVVSLVGAELAEQLRATSIAVYTRAEELARERGIVLADTKFEFGRSTSGGFEGAPRLVLADEVLTPDSSRYWPADRWQPGSAQPSFDKQFVRDWLTSPESGWDKAGSLPPPPLPDEVVERTRAKYVEAFERITGDPFD